MDGSHRRSEAFRRSKNIKVPIERRSGVDRRESMRDSAEIETCMKKIPTFRGLTSDQCNIIISICSKRLIPGDHYLIREGDKSNAMFVLIKGQLKVVSKSGSFLRIVNELDMVGEMGLFNDSPRSADVVAIEDSVMLRISKKELYELFNRHFGMGTHILLNVIKDLTNRLTDDNLVIEDLKKRRSTLL